MGVELGNLKVGYDDFRKYDIENMSAVPLLYQSGYLTITDYDSLICWQSRTNFTANGFKPPKLP